MSQVKPKVEAIYQALGFIKTVLVTIGVGVLIGILKWLNQLLRTSGQSLKAESLRGICLG